MEKTMFEAMKEYLKNDELDGQFGYDDKFSDYVNDIYCQASEKLCEITGDSSIYIEPSIQCGCGGVFMSTDHGSTNWDFESECDTLLEFAEDADTEEEFKNYIVNFLQGKYEDVMPEDEEEEDEEDEDMEEEI